MWNAFFFGTLLALSWTGGQCQQSNEDWWEHMQLYQIYPRSFMDFEKSDGIGDLKGIKERLGHLVDIGVTATWISPMFVSPLLDFGYDIQDFYKVADEYGTNADLVDIIEEANKLGIRILLDYVPNHTSDKCEWFIKSENKTSGWEDFYVWHEGRPNITHPGERNAPPSNWISVFRGSMWTWSDIREEYYLHQFLKEQPDLNYRNPAVVKEMKNVLQFWLSKGVSGFRVDAIPHLVEADIDPDTGFYPDEEVSGGSDDPESYDYHIHTHTRERSETWDVIRGWRETVDEFKESNNTETKILLMEAMSGMDIVMQYYGNETHPIAHFPMNFELTYLNGGSNAKVIKEKITTWFDKIPPGRVTNWVIGNHDQRRAVTRFGTERIDGVMMMNLLLPGIAVTYQGEEIQMPDFYLTWEQTVDPQACLSGIERYNSTSRDPCRTPFQWDGTLNAGFSDKPLNCCWLPIADNYRTLNLDTQKKEKSSPYHLYKQLSELRNTATVKYGSFRIETLNDDCLVFMRQLNQDQVVVIMNTGDFRMIEDITAKFSILTKGMIVEIASKTSNRGKGERVDPARIELAPYEALVLRSSGMIFKSSFIIMIILASLLQFLK